MHFRSVRAGAANGPRTCRRLHRFGRSLENHGAACVSLLRVPPTPPPVPHSFPSILTGPDPHQDASCCPSFCISSFCSSVLTSAERVTSSLRGRLSSPTALKTPSVPPACFNHLGLPASVSRCLLPSSPDSPPYLPFCSLRIDLGNFLGQSLKFSFKPLLSVAVLH